MTAPTPLPTPPGAPLHPAEVVVDLAAVRDNVATLRAAAGSAAVMAVVKADAYGHGLVPSARAAVAGGAGWLGVAQAGEALELRAAGLAGARPGLALRPGRRPRPAGAGRRRPVGERALGARPGGRRRPSHRSRGQGAPQGRHRPRARRQHGRGLGRAGALGGEGRGVRRGRGRGRLVAHGQRRRPRSPHGAPPGGGLPRRRRRRDPAGGAAAAAPPRQLRGHPDQPGHAPRPGAARPRRLRALPGAAARGPRRAGAAACDVAARPTRPGQGRACGTGGLVRARLHDARGDDARAGAAGLRRRRAAARVRGRARCRWVASAPPWPGGCAWTSSSSTSDPVRGSASRPATSRSCSATAATAPPRRTGPRRPGRSATRSSPAPAAALPRRYTGLGADEPSGTVDA